VRSIDMTDSIDYESGMVLNIDKPQGMTSFGVVKTVRRLTACRKVGHAGTLDPMASGVLVICTGKATKRVSECMNMPKVYEGTITLGQTTSTDDAEGETLVSRDVPPLTEDVILSTLSRFEGEIQQVPPMYSAIKQNGQRLYKLARKGVIVDRKPRTVKIAKINLLRWKDPFIDIRVHCSRGTYIRALARDVGEVLQTGAHLSYLRRMRVGPYCVEDALTLNAFKTMFSQVV